MAQQYGWAVIAIGAAIVLIGIGLLVAPSIPGLGRLPGDIRIERNGYRFYFPVATCLLVSILLTLAIWIWRTIQRP